MGDRATIILTFLLLALVAGLTAWWLQTRSDAPSPVAVQPPAESGVPPAEEPARGPRFPLPERGESAKPDLRPLPPLGDSDEYFRMDLADVFGEEAAAVTVSDALIERVVATVDSLPRQRVAERVRPIEGMPTPFAVVSQDSSGEYLLGEDNFRRYDALVEQFVATDLDRLVELYRRYYPLLQKAYVGLGYPDGYFNDRLVEVIDHLLATPDLRGPIALVRPHVLYEFADEELESLSGGQKMMLRIGPRNRERLSSRLRDFRERIAGDSRTQ